MRLETWSLRPRSRIFLCNSAFRALAFISADLLAVFVLWWPPLLSPDEFSFCFLTVHILLISYSYVEFLYILMHKKTGRVTHTGTQNTHAHRYTSVRADALKYNVLFRVNPNLHMQFNSEKLFPRRFLFFPSLRVFPSGPTLLPCTLSSHLLVLPLLFPHPLSSPCLSSPLISSLFFSSLLVLSVIASALSSFLSSPLLSYPLLSSPPSPSPPLPRPRAEGLEDN